MSKRAAIILAGGRGSRFQTKNGTWKDKGRALLQGKPLLLHAIENVRQTVDETLVVVHDEARQDAYSKLLGEYGFGGIKVVVDVEAKTSGGPLIAILTGLKNATADLCLTVPSDMPMLSPKVADYMFEALDDSSVAVPMWPDGRLETLLMVLQRKKCLEIAEVLCQLGRDRPDDIIRGALKDLFVSPMGEIKRLDPELKSFVNINCPKDLSQLTPRRGKGTTSEDVRLNLGEYPKKEVERLFEASVKLEQAKFLEASEILWDTAKVLEEKDVFFWAAVCREYEGKSRLSQQEFGKESNMSKVKQAFLKAAESYSAEAEIYEQNGCFRLAERTKADQAWCETQAKNARG